jgi:hypothetical protein
MDGGNGNLNTFQILGRFATWPFESFLSDVLLTGKFCMDLVEVLIQQVHALGL